MKDRFCSQIISLNELNRGKTGRIKKLICSGLKRKRFLDFGFIKGTKVRAIIKSPFNGPTAYSINETIIAIRGEDAKNILVDLMG
ncbi:MAG: ferrous iron transport protein A [Oscillospiraceae bacterium]|nr:ferrous iron transport protein A [Oscillospiraceae bacterium]